MIAWVAVISINCLSHVILHSLIWPSRRVGNFGYTIWMIATMLGLLASCSLGNDLRSHYSIEMPSLLKRMNQTQLPSKYLQFQFKRLFYHFQSLCWQIYWQEWSICQWKLWDSRKSLVLLLYQVIFLYSAMQVIWLLKYPRFVFQLQHWYLDIGPLNPDSGNSNSFLAEGNQWKIFPRQITFEYCKN